MPTITLTDGPDVYTAIGGPPLGPPTSVYALAGNDTITASGGWETNLYLGDGDDYVIDAGTALLRVFGESGDDRIDIYTAHVMFDGGPGNNVVNLYGGTVSGSGDDGADQFNFFADNDGTLWGNGGDDIFDAHGHAMTGSIYGGDGADQFIDLTPMRDGSFIRPLTLEGGPGNDTFIGTAAEMSGIAIADFSQGDRIIFRDATLPAFSFVRSGDTLYYSGGSLTFDSILPGKLVAEASPSGGVELLLRSDPSSDFNSDGRSDILFRDSTGAALFFYGTETGGFTPGPTLNWNPDSAIVGLGDFNGDGREDILFDGIVARLQTISAGFQPDFEGAAALPAGWSLAGTGDFNGDSRTDVLLRNVDGGTTVWLAGAPDATIVDVPDAPFVPDPNFSLNPGLDWHIAGTGDFNGDGLDDILWRSDNGTVVDLLGQSNGAFIGNVNFNLNPGLDWHIVGTGDFNGDGLDDILWRSDEGTVVDFLGQPNGAFVSNGNFNLNPGPDWHVLGTGDYNHDNFDDILWRNDAGTIVDLLGEPHGSFVGNVSVNLNIGLSWQLQPDHIGWAA